MLHRTATIHVCLKHLLFLSTLESDQIHLTSRSNFAIRLFLGCPGLESDTSRFSMHKNGQSHGDPSCKLCDTALEDATHLSLHAPCWKELQTITTTSHYLMVLYWNKQKTKKDDYDCYVRSSNKRQLHKGRCFSEVSTNLLDKAKNLTAFVHEIIS